jgi:hypothetical protein
MASITTCEKPPQATVFLSLAQNERSSMIFIVRSPRVVNDLAPTFERALTAIEPKAIITVQSWDGLLEGTNALFPARASVATLGVMGALAAMLAVTGIFGMAAYNVSRRMKELASASPSARGRGT